MTALQGCLVVSRQGGPHTLYCASPVAGVRAFGPDLNFISSLTISGHSHPQIGPELRTEVLSILQELVLEPLPGPSAAASAQPASRAAGTALASDSSPAQMPPSAVPGSTTSSSTAEDPAAPSDQPAAAVDWASLRTWPQVSAAEPANSLSQTCESAAQDPAAGEPSPRHADPPHGAADELAWSAGSSGELRPFPCHADVPQQMLVHGMAAVSCHNAASGSRPSVALLDSAGRLSVVPVNVF